MKNLDNGILPGNGIKPKEVEAKEFGWLSPTGEFTESPFGEHEESAERAGTAIIIDKEYDDSYICPEKEPEASFS